MAVDTIPQRLLNRAAEHPDLPAYHVRGPAGWTATSWGTYGDQVKGAAKAFMALGLPLDGKVAMLGFNSPSWVILPSGNTQTSSPCASAASMSSYACCSSAENGRACNEH